MKRIFAVKFRCASYIFIAGSFQVFLLPMTLLFFSWTSSAVRKTELIILWILRALSCGFRKILQIYALHLRLIDSFPQKSCSQAALVSMKIFQRFFFHISGEAKRIICEICRIILLNVVANSYRRFITHNDAPLTRCYPQYSHPVFLIWKLNDSLFSVFENYLYSNFY